jgi:phospholipid/cholesterol/gamma-HCH transport system substrate-binding protein
MNVKFNKYERAAGLFVIVAIIGSFAIAISVAVQKGWFAHKVQFSTVFENADGVHSGTGVQIAGLHAGSVEEVELKGENKIKVTFTVLQKFAEHIRQDSKAQLVRPFIIGERVLEVTVGKDNSPILAENSLLPSYETLDLMTLLSNKTLINNMESMAEMVDKLKVLLLAFSDQDRAKSIVRIFDKLEPLVNNLNDMGLGLATLSKQATKHDNLAIVLDNTKRLTNELNAVLPIVKKNAPELGRNMTIIVNNLAQLTQDFNVVLPMLKAKAPGLGSDITKIMSNLAQITQDLRTLTPAIVEMAPTLPKTGRRTVELIDEFVVLAKALQKSFLLQSNVEEVRKEEALSTQAIRKK